MAKVAQPKSSVSLKFLRAAFNGVNDNGELPERIKIFDWGTNKTNQGDVTVNETTLECFSGNQRRLARETIHIDFNHNTVPGTEAYQADKEPRATAGYGVPIVIKGKGMFVEAIETTPTGVKSAADYKDLSPAPFVDDKGTVVGLHSVALCQAGSTEGLTLCDAAQKALSAELKSLAMPTIGLRDTNKDDSMPNAYRQANDQQYTNMYENNMKQIKDFMDNPSNESYEQVCAMLKAHYTTMGGKKGPLDSPRPGTEITTQTLSAEDVTKAIEASLKPLTARIETLTTEIEGSRKSLEQAERDAVITQASKDGKVIPLSADTLKTLPLSALKEMVGQLKPVVPMKTTLRTLTADGKPEKKTRSDSARAIEESIVRQYGETALKQNRN